MQSEKQPWTRLARVALAAAWVALLPASSPRAQRSAEPGPPAMVTDRPDQTESSSIVPPGTTQLEAGWVFSREDKRGVRLDTFEVPGSLVRIGVTEGFELRAGWSGYIAAEAEADGIEIDVDGAGDGSVGGKIGLWKPARSSRNGGSRQSTGALIATLSLPVGEDDLSSERADPSFRLSVSHDLAEDLGLGYNLGIQWESTLDEGGERDTLSDAIYTLALGFGNVASRPRLGAFVELFGAIPASASGGPRHSIDGGFVYLLRPNLQLDLSAGLGLSDDADDWFLASGLSVRFPR